VLPAILVATFMSLFDIFVVNVAAPSIGADLKTSNAGLELIVAGYSFAYAAGLITGGRLGDRSGRRRMFLAGMGLFTIASALCGFAPNETVLIAGRLVQGAGAAAMVPQALAIINVIFPPAERARAFAYFGVTVGLGAVSGQVIGGLLVDLNLFGLAWRPIFLVNVPIGLVLIALTAKFIPASATRPASRIDIRGILLLAVSIATAMFGITYLGSGQVPLYSPVFLGCEAVAAGTVYLFLRHSRRDSAPFVPYRLLRGRGFGVMNLINYVYGAAALGFGALVPLYAQERYHIAPLGAGTLLTARAVGMIAVAGAATMALRRTGYRLPMIGGFVIVAGGLVMMAAPPSLSPYAWLAIAAAITGCGMGLSVPAANNASLQLAPDQVAAIAGLRGMFRQSGAITAVSVTTAVIARSADPGVVQARVFLIFAALLVAMLPLVMLVPDHHGNW
jgi:EmrB/QacA subfamily drug resistance transporter